LRQQAATQAQLLQQYREQIRDPRHHAAAGATHDGVRFEAAGSASQDPSILRSHSPSSVPQVPGIVLNEASSPTLAAPLQTWQRGTTRTMRDFSIQTEESAPSTTDEHGWIPLQPLRESSVWPASVTRQLPEPLSSSTAMPEPLQSGYRGEGMGGSLPTQAPNGANDDQALLSEALRVHRMLMSQSAMHHRSRGSSRPSPSEPTELDLAVRLAQRLHMQAPRPPAI
jgi:hypothetical protein